MANEKLMTELTPEVLRKLQETQIEILEEIVRVCEKYNLRPEEILVVDDLKPGYDMARSGGAHFAAAGWAYDVPEIREFMHKNCDYYLSSVEELKALLNQN